MFVFWKIWHALLSRYLRFDIRPFALLPTSFRCILSLRFAGSNLNEGTELFLVRILLYSD